MVNKGAKQYVWEHIILNIANLSLFPLPSISSKTQLQGIGLLNIWSVFSFLGKGIFYEFGGLLPLSFLTLFIFSDIIHFPSPSDFFPSTPPDWMDSVWSRSKNTQLGQRNKQIPKQPFSDMTPLTMRELF